MKIRAKTTLVVFETKAVARDAAFETKRQPFTLEQMSESDGTFSGKGMVFDSEHPTSSWQLGPEWKDRVRPGAFAESLAAHEAAGTKPLMLFMHQRGNIPGVWTDVKETKSALQLSGQVSKNAVTPSGVPLLELMKMGAVTGLSIGFKPTSVTLDETKKLRDINSVDLTEVSIVDVPGSPVSRITDVKRDKRSLEEALRRAGYSRSEAKAFVGRGFEEELAVTSKNLSKGAYGMSADAQGASNVAHLSSDAGDHSDAADAHLAAAEAHDVAGAAKLKKGDAVAADLHARMAKAHRDSAEMHGKAAKGLRAFVPEPMGAAHLADLERLAAWTTAYVDDLPDSSFLHVEAGGKKDSDGKTTPRSLRHFPYKDADGAVDLPHLRNALARIPQSSLPQSVKDKLTTKAEKLLEDANDGGADDSSEGPSGAKKSEPDLGETLVGFMKDVKESLSLREADGAQRDAAGSTAESIVGLANSIRKSL